MIRNKKKRRSERKKNRLKEEKRKKDFEKGCISVEIVENLEEEQLPNPQDTDSMKILKINKNELSKNKIDRWQLWFYRLTSDHHTDLLKIVVWLLSAMALFGVLLFAHRYRVDFDRFSHTHSTHPLIKPLIPYISQWITQTKFLGLAYILLVCGIIFKKTRGLVSLSVVLSIISIQPKYILGIAGLMSENIQMQGMFENLLFVFYSFFIALFLFSLQKTARKNSIIPS